MAQTIKLIEAWKQGDSKFALCEVGNENRLFKLEGDAALESELIIDPLPADFEVLPKTEHFAFNNRVAFVARQFKGFKRLFPEATIHVTPIQRVRAPAQPAVVAPPAPVTITRIRSAPTNV